MITRSKIKALIVFWKWMSTQPKDAAFMLDRVIAGKAFVASDAVHIDIPEFIVIDDPNRERYEPFQKRYPDGKYGWCIRNADNGYFFLAPVITGDFEHDRLYYSRSTEDGEPSVA